MMWQDPKTKVRLPETYRSFRPAECPYCQTPVLHALCEVYETGMTIRDVCPICGAQVAVLIAATSQPTDDVDAWDQALFGRGPWPGIG